MKSFDTQTSLSPLDIVELAFLTLLFSLSLAIVGWVHSPARLKA